MNTLNDKELEKVIGGTNAHTDEKGMFKIKKEEFEAAWDALNMEKKYTGNMRAEIFEDWEAADYKPSAVKYLSKMNK
ncbi:MAG: bacteriocin [Butyrivibrio sp.]|uniref:bacteriocin n=1 Tax=Butyrivibrio sp. TaxID=28121 RepID=UPI0025B8FCE8|nr:bacteriocin [Butyrivibrio sp.]MBQ6587397.1 bacteriocin [Butyrivibrio sp.]